MENNINKNRKIIIAAAVFCVIVIAVIIGFAASCNSGNKKDADIFESSNENVYDSTDAGSDADADNETEDVVMGDNEVPFDDAAANDMASGETMVYVVTKEDGSAVTEADGTVVTTVVDISNKGDNEVDFGEKESVSVTDESGEKINTEASSENGAQVQESSVAVDKDGWTTIIVKP